MTYVQVETGPLTDRQLGRIRLFQKTGTRGERIRIRLTPAQLNGSGTTFLVTMRDHDKMKLAQQAEKSVLIELSMNWVKENVRRGWFQRMTDGYLKKSMQGEGPVLSTAVAALLPAATSVATDIIGDIFGSGGEDPMSMRQKLDAVELLSDEKVLERIESCENAADLMAVVNDVSNITEQSGRGWKEALKWGALFLNPAGFITGPLAVNAKIAQKMAGKGAPLKFY